MSTTRGNSRRLDLSEARPAPGGMLCADDPELWFTDANKHGIAAKVKLLCEQCDLLKSCRKQALATGEEYGIWGGMTAAERKRHPDFRKQPYRPPTWWGLQCPLGYESDSTTRGAKAHYDHGQAPCAVCKASNARRSLSRRETATA